MPYPRGFPRDALRQVPRSVCSVGVALAGSVVPQRIVFLQLQPHGAENRTSGRQRQAENPD